MSPSVSRVGIVAKSHLRAAAPHLAEIVAWLDRRGIKPVFETATAALCATAGASQVSRSLDKLALVSAVDMVLVLGGDGCAPATAST